jgi:probable HAF family extracellular repeat protein
MASPLVSRFLCVPLLAICGTPAIGQPVIAVYPPSRFNPSGVSGNGVYTVGTIYYNNISRAARWHGSVEELASAAGEGDSMGNAISFDGSVIVGYRILDGRERAFRWSSSQGQKEDLGSMPGGVGSRASAVNADGTVVVGYGDSEIGYTGFRWTPGEGMVRLDLPADGSFPIPYGMSADGRIIAGYAGSDSFRWTLATGSLKLDSTPFGWADARGMSGDGAVLVGRAAGYGPYGAIWREATGWTVPNPLAGASQSAFNAVNGNGMIAVGYSNTPEVGWTAMIWTPATGTVDLREYLQSLGAVVPTRLYAAVGVSADGSVIVGGLATGGHYRVSGLPVLCPPPSVTLQPVATSVAIGGAAQIQCAASGHQVTYRWRKAGSPLTDGPTVAGAETSVLSLLNFQQADQGEYDCQISSPCGYAATSSTLVTCRPVVTQQPSGGDYHAGDTIVLSAAVSSNGATSYRWRRDGTTLFNAGPYTGATSPNLTIRATDPSQSGEYVLSTTNPCGVTTTVPVFVGVTCAADWNGDGGVDGDDVILFFQQWDENSSDADFTRDGSVDGDDVIGFFGRWDLGC